MEAIIFFACAAAVLAGGLGVVLGRNPVHCALFLLMTLVSVAVLFLQLNAALVAAIQIVVYASAVVVLFLFVITLLGVDKREALTTDRYRFQLVASVVLGVLLAASVVIIANDDWTTGARSTRGVLDPTGEGNIYAFSKSLFTDFLWPFEITAVLLVIAVVGGVVLARRSGQRTEIPEDQDA